MAAGDPILDLSDYVNLVTGGNSGTPEQLWWFKDARQNGGAAAAPVSGRLTSLWQYDGFPSGASNTAPTTAAVPTNATDGALKQTSPGGGRTKRIAGYNFGGCTAAGTIIVYDRLSHQGGLSGTTTTAQTTNLPTAALTRYTTGVGVMPWLEVYTAVGTTATTVTCSYTDQGGTTGNTSLATVFGSAGYNNQNRILPIPLAAGDYGCRAVASVTVLATTGTAGAFGVTLAKPLFIIPTPVLGMGDVRSFLNEPGGPLAIGSDACLGLAFLANTTTIPQLHLGLYFFEK